MILTFCWTLEEKRKANTIIDKAQGTQVLMSYVSLSGRVLVVY